jgi:hypothetical protein
MKSLEACGDLVPTWKETKVDQIASPVKLFQITLETIPSMGQDGQSPD